MRHLLPLTFALVALGGCNSTTPAGEIDTGTGTTTCAPAKAKGPGPVASLTDPTGQAPPQVTFYGDLLPILDSSSSGAAYKCTTCHANFKTPDSMNNVDMITSVITDMQTGKMPRPGDLVPPNKIALFSAWQLQGFTAGTPGQAPSNFDVSTLSTAAAAGAASTTAATPCTSASKP